MIIYLVLLGLLVIIGPNNRVQFRGIHEDYISKDNTDAIRGIFILTILAFHFTMSISANYTSAIDLSYRYIRNSVGQLVVAPFLFYSGYGIRRSIRLKGKDYVLSMPRTRILKILFIYDIIQVAFLILNALLKIKKKHILLAFFAITKIGSDNWYIFDILILYGFTFLSSIIFSNNEKRAAAMDTCLIAGMIVLLKMWGRPSRYYNTLLCYAAGQWFSIYRFQIEKALKRDSTYVLTLCLSVVLCFIFYKQRKELISYELSACLFALLIVLGEMKFVIGSPVLKWCGKNLLSFFLTHRLALVFLEEKQLIDNDYLRFVVFLIMTLLLTVIFSKVIRLVNQCKLFQTKAVPNNQ